MRKLQISVVILSLLAMVGCKNDTKKAEEEVTEVVEEVVTKTKKIQKKSIAMALESKSGSTATGKLELKEVEGVVMMHAIVQGLSPGTHAIHIHETADCSSEDGKSTGGHWNPTFEPHGKWGAEEGFHKGDIGNFEANEDGMGSITFETDQWCIGCGDEKKDIVGKAIIVHQGVDDFTSQPSGAAGARISCGGIIQ